MALSFFPNVSKSSETTGVTVDTVTNILGGVEKLAQQVGKMRTIRPNEELVLAANTFKTLKQEVQAIYSPSVEPKPEIQEEEVASKSVSTP